MFDVFFLSSIISHNSTCDQFIIVMTVTVILPWWTEAARILCRQDKNSVERVCDAVAISGFTYALLQVAHTHRRAGPIVAANGHIVFTTVAGQGWLAGRDRPLWMQRCV
jgi:hypothetical protein